MPLSATMFMINSAVSFQHRYLEPPAKRCHLVPRSMMTTSLGRTWKDPGLEVRKLYVKTFLVGFNICFYITWKRGRNKANCSLSLFFGGGVLSKYSPWRLIYHLIRIKRTPPFNSFINQLELWWSLKPPVRDPRIRRLPEKFWLRKWKCWRRES